MRIVFTLRIFYLPLPQGDHVESTERGPAERAPGNHATGRDNGVPGAHPWRGTLPTHAWSAWGILPLLHPSPHHSCTAWTRCMQTTKGQLWASLSELLWRVKFSFFDIASHPGHMIGRKLLSCMRGCCRGSPSPIVPLMSALSESVEKSIQAFQFIGIHLIDEFAN